jgi:hypothetical protein
MILMLPQPPDLEAQIDRAFFSYLNAKGKEAEQLAYAKFATLIGLRRQPKAKKFAHECRNSPADDQTSPRKFF